MQPNGLEWYLPVRGGDFDDVYSNDPLGSLSVQSWTFVIFK